MKVLITLQLILIISIPSFSQPYFGIGLQNKGFNMSAGIVADNIDAQIMFKTPLTSAEESKVLSLTIGRMINITNKDEDNYSITPLIGLGWSKYQDFSQYDLDDKAAIIDVNKFSGVYGLEIGKDAHVGRISLMGRYCGSKMYYGVTMRVFFSR